MTEREALKIALDALKTLMIERGSIYDKAITAIKEALAQPELNYKKALEMWLEKTEWVQETVKPHELGMHRADILKQRIEESLVQPEQHQDWCASLTQMLMSMPPKPAPCNCKPKPEPLPWIDKMVIDVPNQILYTAPQRTWVGLTPQERDEINEKVYGAVPHHVAFHHAIEQALREKNT